MTASEVFRAIPMEVVPLRSTCLTLQPAIQFLLVFAKVGLASVVQRQHPCPPQSQLLFHPQIQLHIAVAKPVLSKYGIKLLLMAVAATAVVQESRGCRVLKDTVKIKLAPKFHLSSRTIVSAIKLHVLQQRLHQHPNPRLLLQRYQLHHLL